ncbi:MAG: hypothetical protein O3B13_26230, partial [Planctomycetota bacterium]|nr:hypothetical protein [Planctomycetota bacterium]
MLTNRPGDEFTPAGCVTPGVWLVGAARPCQPGFDLSAGWNEDSLLKALPGAWLNVQLPCPGLPTVADAANHLEKILKVR